MVFVPEWKELKGPNQPPFTWTDPIPPAFDPETGIYRYVVMSLEGDIENPFAYPVGAPALEVDPLDEWEGVFGWPIKKHWNDRLATDYPYEFGELKGIKEFVDGDGREATWIWDSPASWESGVTGSQTIVFATMLPVIGKIVEDYIPFYFACDNAAAVYVNGDLVGITEWAFEGVAESKKPGKTFDWRFEGFGADDFDGDPWYHVYVADLAGKLKTGENSIVIVAANSDTNGGKWNETNNPAGLLFACEWTSKK